MTTRIDSNFMQDFTVAINKVPRGWNLLDELNLATTDGISTTTANVDVVTEKTGVFGDSRRGGPRNFVGSESVITKPLATTFFTLDGVVRPTDLQNLRKWGTENELQDGDTAVRNIMERLRRYHGALREKALMEAIKGANYAPNGTTEAYNYYTVFGQTQKTIAFDLAGSSDPIAKAEEAWGHIIDNADDGASSYEVIAICGTGFFAGLLANDVFQAAFTYQQDRPNPLRDRVGGGSIYREFTYGNVRYIEYRGAFGGTKLVADDKAYFLPLGIMDHFAFYHSPADHLDYMNTTGQETYMWIHRDPKGRKIDVESETSFICVNHRPELVVLADSGATVD